HVRRAQDAVVRLGTQLLARQHLIRKLDSVCWRVACLRNGHHIKDEVLVSEVTDRRLDLFEKAAAFPIHREVWIVFGELFHGFNVELAESTSLEAREVFLNDRE